MSEVKKQELVDILDHNGCPTGKVHVRGTPLDPGDLTGAALVCVINSEQKMLIQQRAADKKSWPGKWDITCGGAMNHGETPQDTAMRELKEETGLTVDLNGVRASIVTLYSDGFSYTFVVKMDVDLDEVVLQKEEVQAARFADIEEIMAMVEKDEFVPYRRSWMEYVFDLARQEFLF